MKKFLGFLAFVLAVAGIVKLLFTIVPEVDDDVESINTTGREYITL